MEIMKFIGNLSLNRFFFIAQFICYNNNFNMILNKFLNYKINKITVNFFSFLFSSWTILHHQDQIQNYKNYNNNKY